MSLAITYDDLRARIGWFLGWGRDTANWGSSKEAICEDILKSGLRMFYWPHDERGRDYEHDWSFLKILHEITVSDNQSDYLLPEDFGGLAGSVYYKTDSDGWRAIRHVPISQILNLRQQAATRSQSTWRVEFCSVNWRRMEGSATSGQRAELMLWPDVTADFNLKLQYNVNPESMSTSQQYPYGGTKFAECLLEACLAAAERHVNDRFGEHYQAFNQLLAQAIDMDQRATAPDFIGMNLDRSDKTGAFKTHRRYGTVTVDGVQY